MTVDHCCLPQCLHLWWVVGSLVNSSPPLLFPTLHTMILFRIRLKDEAPHVFIELPKCTTDLSVMGGKHEQLYQDNLRSCRAHFSTGSALGSASMLLQSLSNNNSPNMDAKNPGMAFILLLRCCHHFCLYGHMYMVYSSFQNSKTCIISDI